MIFFACIFLMFAAIAALLACVGAFDLFFLDGALSEYLRKKMRAALEKKGGGDDGRC